MTDIMDEIRGIFLDEMKTRIASLQESLAGNDIAQIQYLGHKIRGTGGSFGFPEVTDMGGVLEQSAKAGNWSSIRTKISELVAWYDATSQPDSKVEEEKL